MKTIFKYELGLHATQTIKVPYTGFTPRCVQIQNGVICLWAEVDTEDPIRDLTINILGTGQEAHFDMAKEMYVGTVQINGFVWHIYY
jgi:hypothetical protein